MCWAILGITFFQLEFQKVHLNYIMEKVHVFAFPFYVYTNCLDDSCTILKKVI